MVMCHKSNRKVIWVLSRKAALCSDPNSEVARGKLSTRRPPLTAVIIVSPLMYGERSFQCLVLSINLFCWNKNLDSK